MQYIRRNNKPNDIVSPNTTNKCAWGSILFNFFLGGGTFPRQGSIVAPFLRVSPKIVPP